MTQNSLVKSLPPRALLESEIDKLTTHDRIGNWESTLAIYQSEFGEELVFNFIIEIGGKWHALVLHEDGMSGWKSLGVFDDFGTAGREISEWQKKCDI